MSKNKAIAESNLRDICCRILTADELSAARLSLLDWLGCILAARSTPVAGAWSRSINVPVDELMQNVLLPSRCNTQTAALVLGGLGNVLEMDDLHRASILHPGDTICAAALAVALRRPTSGAELLTAIVRGYEIATRIGSAVAAGGYTPFYNSGTCGVFGAAMAAATLHKLPDNLLADALGQAGMQAAGIWQCRLEPTFSKQLATAHAARAGVLSAELGAAGFPGARAILTGEMGFFASYYPGADVATMTNAGPWAVTQMSYKPFPACRHTHPAISAALDLPKVPYGQIKKVDIHTYGAAIDFCDNAQPDSADAARFSLQHAVAVTLYSGAPDISDFDPACLTAPVLASLRTRVALHCDPAFDAAFPAQYGARVTVQTAQGTFLTADCPAAWGDPENPMTEADLLAKFHRNTTHGGMACTHSKRLASAVLALPDAADLTDLTQAITLAVTPEPETP